MIVQILLLITGLVTILLGANWTIDGASDIARKAHVSDFIIGLTIVGFGTSCPELVVSTIGALQGNSDIAIGNVFGSNIFNVAMALGLTATLIPISMTQRNKSIDVPIALLVSFLFLIFGFSGGCITRLEAVIFLLLFIGYIFLVLKINNHIEDEFIKPSISTRRSIILTIVGLIGLIGGGRLFVLSAENLGKILGLSDKVIGTTILAGGTSFPELATCLVAAYKKKGQMALGDILGSNIFNILLILGVGALIHPLSFEHVKIYDAVALILTLFVISAASLKSDRKIGKLSGVILIIIYCFYFYSLLFLN